VCSDPGPDEAKRPRQAALAGSAGAAMEAGAVKSGTTTAVFRRNFEKLQAPNVPFELVLPTIGRICSIAVRERELRRGSVQPRIRPSGRRKKRALEFFSYQARAAFAKSGTVDA